MAPDPRHRLVLFDIDGTLIHQGRMGSTALRRAFLLRHQLQDALGDLRLDGKTDWSICQEVFERHGIGWSDEAWQGIVEAYLEALHEEAHLRPSGRLCPGVAPLLERLSRVDSCQLGLLTGNVRRGAEIKLRTFGIWDYFRVGAYGCDRPRRPELVAVALDRAERELQRRYEPQSTVIVGDTPADVETALLGGCRAVAVATGRFGVEELRACGADVVLQDLADLPAVLQALGIEAAPLQLAAEAPRD